MKLTRADATNYRNIIDANPVDIAQSTCLVGKNEAGKTTFLKALGCLHSTNADFKQYGKTENYPRRYLSDDSARPPDGEAVIMRTEWETFERSLNINDVNRSKRAKIACTNLAVGSSNCHDIVGQIMVSCHKGDRSCPFVQSVP
jgi:predicted ATP-dependent endonuclease of OLD family